MWEFLVREHARPIFEVTIEASLGPISRKAEGLPLITDAEFAALSSADENVICCFCEGKEKRRDGYENVSVQVRILTSAGTWWKQRKGPWVAVLKPLRYDSDQYAQGLLQYGIGCIQTHRDTINDGGICFKGSFDVAPGEARLGVPCIGGVERHVCNGCVELFKHVCDRFNMSVTPATVRATVHGILSNELRWEPPSDSDPVVPVGGRFPATLCDLIADWAIPAPRPFE
jgi:hypothetical protein